MIPTGPVEAQEAAKVDPKIPGYKKVGGISGNLSSIGSDTMNNLMTLWAEGFARFYPNVKVQEEYSHSPHCDCLALHDFLTPKDLLLPTLPTPPDQTLLLP
jgi:hypothetical protein